MATLLVVDGDNDHISTAVTRRIREELARVNTSVNRVALSMGTNQQRFSRRMTGKTPWPIDELFEQAYRMPRRGPWFPGPIRGHQRRESVSGTIKEAIVRAGATGSAHQLRHWFGTALVEAGVDLRTVQTLMRHQNLASTEIYIEVKDKRRADAIQLLDPFQIAGAGRDVRAVAEAAA